LANNEHEEKIIYIVDPNKRIENMKLLAQRVVHNLDKEDIPIFAQYFNEALQETQKG